MENLKINNTPKTPLIDFDVDSRVFLLSGISVPENSLEFYGTVIGWLKEYIQTPGLPIKLVFKLTYVNTSSLQFIFDLLQLLDRINANSSQTVAVEWYYSEEDIDMKEMGEDFKEAMGMNFSFFEEETI